MDSAVVSLLSAFVLSLIGLFAFMWSMRKGLFVENPKAAGSIFAAGEIGQADDPSLTGSEQARLQQAITETNDKGRELQQAEDPEGLDDRYGADRSTAFPVFMFIGFAVMWLVFGSIAGLTASLKLHWPDFLVSEAWETFGRMRTYHLTAVLYGWITNAELGIIIWLLPRLMRTPLRGPLWVMMGGALINVGIASAIGGFGMGWTAGMEYLEIPWQIGIFIVAGFVCIIPPVLATVAFRKSHEIYVSAWYHVASILWIAMLFTVAKLPGAHFGVEQATMNWWYGHNVLGLFYTPLSIACVYYFLPKVIGRPVRSYNLSLLGFWTLAFFYGQVGAHHLIGGPIPEWLITLSIVQSVMMIIPVVAFSLNQHLTLQGHFSALKHSHVLRFIFFGAVMYTITSLQGSMEALRSVNAVTHFTHFTVAHAHLGMYGFVSMVIFGGVYFALPRILDVRWPRPALISLHFWLVVAGFAVYIVTLSIGGILQGLILLDPARPFMDSVAVTLPWLQGRSIGGALMTLGHLVFAWHFVLITARSGVLTHAERTALRATTA